MPSSLVKFEDFELDRRRYELRRADRVLKLEKIPMDLLLLLVERNGELVTRDEIVERIWGKDVFLDTEHGINTAVRKIRNALHDDPDQPRFIQTVTGKGYRFIAPTTVIASGNGNSGASALPDLAQSAPSEPRLTPSAPIVSRSLGSEKSARTRRIVVASVLALTAIPVALVAFNVLGIRDRIVPGSAKPQIHSLAVLPLENLSSDPNQEYFADGMTDELITMLAKNADLRVVSRTSVMQYKKVHRPLAEVARELGVDGILEGSVERSGNRIHLNAQLIYAPHERHLWAESYDRDLNDLAALQSELARTIARQAGLATSQLARHERRIKPEARDAYLLGRYYWFASNDVPAIEKYFRKAIDLQPDYAEAWSGLADTYLGGAVIGTSRPADVVPIGVAAARKALELDESLPEVHNSMAGAYLCLWDLEHAERESARAVELNPNYAEGHHLRGYILQALNRIDESIEEQKKSMELDPFARPFALTYALLRARQFDAGLNEARLRIQAQPSNADLHETLSDAYWVNGMDREATQEMEISLRLAGRTPSPEVLKAFERRGYQAVLEWQLSERKKRATGGYVPALEFADVYGRMKRRDETLHYLEEAYKERAPFLVRIQSDPTFDFLHAEPRYQAIVKKMGLPPAS